MFSTVNFFVSHLYASVNCVGGAIALGHPLGCTGARQIATGLAEMKRRKGGILVTSMCVGKSSVYTLSHS